MENASNALLMGAAVLIVILIIGLAKQMFGAASQVTKTYDSTMETSEIREFNQHFTRYMGAYVEENDTVQKPATIHDVITTANFACNQNRQIQGQYCFEINDDYEGIYDTAHIRVDLQAPKLDGGEFTFKFLELYPSSRKDADFSNVYNDLLKQCYYDDKALPSNVVKFEIEIVNNPNESNGSGKINHVIFKTETQIGDRLESIYETIDKNLKPSKP